MIHADCPARTLCGELISGIHCPLGLHTMIELPADNDGPYELRLMALGARLHAATVSVEHASNELREYADELEGRAAALEAGGEGR